MVVIQVKLSLLNSNKATLAPECEISTFGFQGFIPGTKNPNATKSDPSLIWTLSKVANK